MNKNNRLHQQFEPVSPKFNADEEERRILEFWKLNKIFKKSVSNRSKDNRFIFFEGPPTANGYPGIHHVEARAFKDAIPRYQTMRSKRVERKAGWDTHGLPVELQVEKELGISGKPQIENIVQGDKRASIIKFNQLCKESVWKYKTEWELLTERMGFWLDMDHPYVTYENSYIESAWWIISELWKKSLLYEDFKVVPYCPRCGTALSSHEVALGYEEVEDRSVYIKFRVKNKQNTFILAWTTTPWTLPGNVALAVNPKIKYGLYKNHTSSEQLIIADERAQKVLGSDYQKIKNIGTKELLSIAYEPLFNVSPLQSEKSYKIYAANFVTTAEGTGVVHTAVMYGEDDFQLGTKLGLPKCHTVDFEGKFTSDVKLVEGMFVKNITTEEKLVNYLQKKGLFLKEEQYSHTYPFCWRCDTPLIYYAKQSWFIAMSKLRNELIQRNQTITWVPSHLQEGRFGEWLREVKDWALSRDRYWGTPLPIWACEKCDHKICISGSEDIKKYNQKPPKDLHRPYIDDIKFDCPKCKSKMNRYTQVLDCWFDAGAMPFAQWGYPYVSDSVKQIEQNYPANYIAEAIDQTRGWFYTLLAIATALNRNAPYKAVVSLGHVLEKHGKKMSKSRGNVVDPWEVIKNNGVDSLRYYMFSVNQPGEPKKFDSADVTQIYRRTFLILWNTYSFLAGRIVGTDRQSQETEIEAKTRDKRQATRDSSTVSCQMSDISQQFWHILDKWLLIKTNELIEAITQNLDRYDFFRATRILADFITELSTWYLKYSRKRTDESFLPTFIFTLKNTALLLAPFAPFFAEMLWQRLRDNNDIESVHLADWPKYNPTNDEQKNLLEKMKLTQELVEIGLSKRAEAGIKIRQPLNKAIIIGKKLGDEFYPLVQMALNVKTIEYKSAEKVNIELDTNLTDELKVEGLAREIIRGIQELRKTANFKPGQNAVIHILGDHQFLDQLIEQSEIIQSQTGSKVYWNKIAEGLKSKVETLTIILK